MMACSEFRELVADIDCSGLLSADLREQALAHAESCADCGQLLTEAESLEAALRRLAHREADSEAPTRVETQLLRAFREWKGAERHEKSLWYAAVLGMAATVLLAVGFWMYARSSGKAGPVAVTPDNVESSPGLVKHRTEANATATKSIAPTNAPTARNGATVPDQTAEADSAGTFIALPDADDRESLDDGAVVRVEMPRAALASFGLPLDAMEGNGTVRADLIVSSDGTPEAIRFLSEDNENAEVRR